MEKNKCSKVGIWVVQLQLEDGQQQQWNATKEDATVKDVFIQIFWQIISKCQMKASVLELVRVLGKPDIEMQQILND